MTLKQLRNELNIPDVDIREQESVFGIIYESITGQNWKLSLVMDSQPSKSQAEEVLRMIKRANKGEPVQYIIGKWSFMGLEFSVNSNVLIPRADTEILCERVIEYINSSQDEVSVLDLCTGSGCIGISIACSTGARVACSDISREALAVAEQNAVKNNAEVELIHSDMLSRCGVYDIIASNPPYIPSSTVDELSDTVKNYEPRGALDGGDDGLDFYRIIARDAKAHLNVDGRLFLEIGYDQGQSVSEIMLEAGYQGVECVKDYGGNDRLIICTWKG